MVSNDLVVRFENRFLQLKPKRRQGLGAGSRVTVQQSRDGELRVVRDERGVVFEEIAKPAPQAPAEAKPRRAPPPHKPSANHPWRRSLNESKQAVRA